MRASVKDLGGMVFGRLMAVSFAGSRKKHADWLCRCECGSQKVISGTSLLTGATRSCGCLGIESRITHGMCDSVEYRRWDHMIRRCTLPSNRNYKNYGGRGISVHRSWLRFEQFYADMGPIPGPVEEYSIERRNVDLGYYAGNCYWATKAEQAANKRTIHWIRVNGERVCLTRAAEAIGMKPQVLSQRIRAGWTVEEAMATPVRVYHKRVPQYA